jgi:hemerythrin-like domain-containing protein
MLHDKEMDRRAALLAVAGIGILATLEGCGEKDEGEEIPATEDMMREHGVLRRILVAYREAATMIRSNAAFDVAALADAADLFRSFGEDYHEHKLEEEHVFPAVRKAGGPAAGLIDTLLRQHQRGREINQFLIATCKGGAIADARRQDVVSALESYARMYEAHAAHEDTVIFQAWRKSLSKHALKEASERFEDIEKAQFKGDGFDQAVDRIAGIEQRLGIADLERFTAAPIGRLAEAARG